jgi:hypothetical protein
MDDWMWLVMLVVFFLPVGGMFDRWMKTKALVAEANAKAKTAEYKEVMAELQKLKDGMNETVLGHDERLDHVEAAVKRLQGGRISSQKEPLPRIIGRT